MKFQKSWSAKLCLIGLNLSLLSVLPAQGQTTAFNFQGRLSNLGLPVNGYHDLRFAVYGSQAGSDLISGPITVSPVAVKQGTFNCRLDFGEQVFNGSARWLDISVRPTGTANYTNLTPRVELTSAPYAIRAKEAAVAASVANGSAVKSLNTLKDNVTLSPGPNITITPSGNTLTIGSTAGGGGGWSTLNNNTYYNAGNVGIGITNPTSRLELYGAQDALGITGYQPVLTFRDTSFSNIRSAIQSAGGGLNLFSGTYLDEIHPWGFLRLSYDGSVGIGVANPNSALDVASPNRREVLRLSGPQPYLTIFDSAAGYARGRLETGAGSLSLQTENCIDGLGPAAGTIYLQNGSGNVGISTDNPQHKLHIVGEGASGYSIGITGNATQNRDKGGWVKAMAKVNANGSVARQFSAYGGAITAVKAANDTYLVTFPFQISDRFISMTPIVNESVGSVEATVRLNCSQCGGYTVQVLLWSELTVSYVANEFFIFVY